MRDSQGKWVNTLVVVSLCFYSVQLNLGSIRVRSELEF